jgi:type IV secretion system protein VirB5
MLVPSVIYLATKPVTTEVVLVDKLGNVLGEALRSKWTGEEEDMVRRGIIWTFVQNLRTLTHDANMQNQMIYRAYDFLAEGSPAKMFLDEWYREQQKPMERIAAESVMVELRSVLPVSDKLYQVEWTETTRGADGSLKKKELWRGNFEIAVSKPADLKSLSKNPLGIYVTNVNWTIVG